MVLFKNEGGKVPYKKHDFGVQKKDIRDPFA
jgi:hypothetical protein